MTTEPADIVERLRERALYYKTYRPAVDQANEVPGIRELSNRECVEDIAGNMLDAVAEITRLRAALTAERERCARVAEAHVICDWSKLPGKAVDDTFGKQIAAAIRAME